MSAILCFILGMVISSIIIENQNKKKCYKDNNSENKKMIGEYVKFKPGLNTISWIGTVNKVELIYRGRFLN